MSGHQKPSPAVRLAAAATPKQMQARLQLRQGSSAQPHQPDSREGGRATRRSPISSVDVVPKSRQPTPP